MRRKVTDLAQGRGPLVRQDSASRLPLPPAQVALTISAPKGLSLVCKQSENWSFVNVHDSWAIRSVHDQFAGGVASNNHVVPDGQGIEWGAVMRQGFAVFLAMLPSGQNPIAPS
jgi:hypothetical protein